MKQAKAETKRPRGRPRRRDDPRRLTVNLPGELRRWLRMHAALSERDMGDILAELLVAYRRKVKGPRLPSRRKGRKA